MLGRYLAGGLAGVSDIPQAQLWLETAQKAGVTEAELDLARLRKNAAPDRLDRAIARAAP